MMERSTSAIMLSKCSRLSYRWPLAYITSLLSIQILLLLLLIPPCSSVAPAVDLGTTLVAIRFDCGVVVGADSRTSVGGYVSHRLADKMAYMEGCVVARSGSAADTQLLAERARLALEDRRFRYQKVANVVDISHWLRQAVYHDSDKSISLLVAGLDGDGQARIYSLASSGALVEEAAYAAAGSGSTLILGFLDHYCRSPLDEAAAVDLCRQALALAMSRDGSSGGIMRLAVIDAEGVRQSTVEPQAAAVAALEGFAEAQR